MTSALGTVLVFMAVALAMAAMVVLIAAVWHLEGEMNREMERRWPGRE